MLALTGLTYRIAGRTLLEGASATIAAGAKVGFVGRNGTGKTTLFRLLLGELEPESGEIVIPKGARIGTVAQEAPGDERALMEVVLAADTERARLLAEAETARDPNRIAEIHTRLADIDAHSAEARAGRILAGLGFDADAQGRPCSSLSGGWRMRVALAAVLFSEPDILLLDEPTNYLDLEGTLWLENYLARYPHTAIVISHDRDLLNKAVDHILHLENRKLTLYRGGYDSFDRQRRERLALQEAMRRKQEAQRRHMQAFVDRFRYKASKARQAQSRLKALARMEPIAAVICEEVLPIRIPDPARPASPPILTFDGVSVGYESDRPVLTRLDLRIDDDDRIGLLGANGNGKSTFAKLVAGRLAPMAGRMIAAEKLEIAYFAQHQLDELVPSRTAVDHVRALMPGAPEAKIRSRVAQMGLSTERMDTPAGSLSGGEKARLLLGLATFRGPHLLILDEPTNHLDVDAREALVQALAEYSGAVLLISHDRHLIETSVDRLWLVAEGTVRPYDGDLEDYRRLVLDRSGMPQRGPRRGEEDGTISAQERRKQAAERRAGIAPLRRRIRELESRIERLQEDIRRYDAALADPKLFAQFPARGASIAKARAEAVKAVAQAEEAWIALSSELESATAD